MDDSIFKKQIQQSWKNNNSVDYHNIRDSIKNADNIKATGYALVLVLHVSNLIHTILFILKKYLFDSESISFDNICRTWPIKQLVSA